MDQIKQYYTTIFSVAYSACGYYLAAASNYGTVAIFKYVYFNLFSNRKCNKWCLCT